MVIIRGEKNQMVQTTLYLNLGLDNKVTYIMNEKKKEFDKVNKCTIISEILKDWIQNNYPHLYNTSISEASNHF